MNRSIYHRLSSVLWGAIVAFIVLLAIYVSVGRMLTSLTGAYQQAILLELNHRVPFIVDADQVSAEWSSFNPVLVLDGLRLTMPGEIAHSVELAEGRIAIDVAGSLLNRSLQMTQLRLDGLDLAAELSPEGELHITGFSGGDTQIGEWLQHFLLNVERVALGDIHLDLALPGRESQAFELDLALSREGSRRRLEGHVSSSRGFRVSALGEGVGNPLDVESFIGQLYLDIDAVDVGAVTDLFGELNPGVQFEGGAGIELWSSWNKGQPTAEVSVGMRDLRVAAANNTWQLPLDRLAFEASLVDLKPGWGLSVAALEVARDRALLQVPRLQLEVRGETATLRAQEFPLEPASAIFSGIDSLPPATFDVINVLQPRGVLSALQLDISNINTPLADWQLQANFRDLAVDSWQGAPGVTGASGYLELTPGAGFVNLDSQRFSMAFPTVYEKPFYFDDFRGTVNIRWDGVGVGLSSGLIEVEGVQGPARVMFGLSIPLVESDVGLEMDLLVGLQNTDAARREIYIPFVLDETLRDWLATSIDDGLVEQGGFLWRGSLTHLSPLLHTVQLFFNIRDAALDYQSGWPPLADIAGVVLINDTDVSVWADHATLLGSQAQDLSVELWADATAQLWLAIAGHLDGSAADGIAVVNGAPLGQLVGEAFTDWQLTGDLATDVSIRMNLSDSLVPPEVAVSARFAGVDLDIRPGNLPVRGISGILNYSTAAGFSSTGLVGQLWGRPLQANVGQYSPAEAPVAGEKGDTAVTVDFSTIVDMSDVRQWLDVDMLAFAQGSTAVTAKLVVAPAAPVLLSFGTALSGITLDLPVPWGKAAAPERQLRLDLTREGDSLLLGVVMEGGLAARLELTDGHLRAGALQLDGEPGELEAGVMSFSGRMAHADAQEWQRLVTEYFVSDSIPAEGGEASPPLAIAVDRLQVDQLSLGGQDLGGVVLSLADDGGRWRVTAETDWMRGEFLYIPGGRSLLDIHQLDLQGLDRLSLADRSGEQVIELPDIGVNLQGLRQGERVLGYLAFDLHSEGAVLQVQNITGEIAALQLRPDHPGNLVWHQGAESRTTLEATLGFQDLGRTLEQLGYQKIIETEEGSFDLALDWPGGPQAFSLLQAEGSLLVDIGKGRFPEASGGASGALRVVSILNLAEMVQRLSLSHMFESGIPFDKVDGKVMLHAGRLEVPKMDVQGTASGFQFSGVSAVESRTIDGELVVTLPVANNLPWVVALTAGLPVAAGVFLLSKVFENQVNRLTSAVYTTTGNWDDPVVKFDRVFDDTAPAGTDSGASQAAPAAVTPQPGDSVQSSGSP